MMRRASPESVDRIAHLTDRTTLVQADLRAELSRVRAMAEVAPTLSRPHRRGAWSPVMASACFDSELTGVGISRLLEAMPGLDAGNCFYQADRARLASGSVDAGTTAVPPT